MLVSNEKCIINTEQIRSIRTVGEDRTFVVYVDGSTDNLPISVGEINKAIAAQPRELHRAGKPGSLPGTVQC